MKRPAKSTQMCIVLYPESQQYQIDYIKKNFSYAACLHDRDVGDDGKTKKAHYHFYLRFPSARSFASIAKELQIPDHIENCRSRDGAIRYLIHADDPDKYQYEMKDMEFSKDMEKYVSKAFRNSEEDSEAMAILDIINSFSTPVTVPQILPLICSKGLYATFRRGATLFRDCIYFHNELVKGDAAPVAEFAPIFPEV